jgi:hypothetical protein
LLIIAYKHIFLTRSDVYTFFLSALHNLHKRSLRTLFHARNRFTYGKRFSRDKYFSCSTTSRYICSIKCTPRYSGNTIFIKLCPMASNSFHLPISYLIARGTSLPYAKNWCIRSFMLHILGCLNDTYKKIYLLPYYITDNSLPPCSKRWEINFYKI